MNNTAKAYLDHFKARYLKTTFKKQEFILYVLLYFVLIYNMISAPHQAKGIIAILQAFVLFFFAFRFGYLGIIVALFFSMRELSPILALTTSEKTIALVTKLFTIVTVIIVGVLADKQEQHRRNLQKLATTDELTGVYNQRYFHASIEKEVIETKQEGASVGLIMIDIDNFKLFNDIHGHACGDTILRGTGTLLKAISVERSIVCRCGGDEFAIILVDYPLEQIKQIAEDLKANFEVLKKDYFPADLYQKVTLSMGISQFPNMSSDKKELLSQADMALYHAKNLGKDKIHFYQDIIQQIRKGISSDHQQLIGVFKALLSTISIKDKYTLIHSERVSEYSVLIGKALALNTQELTTLQYAGLLHDIGKIEIPKSILNKIEPLSEDEFQIIRQHPIYSENILEPLERMEKLLEYVRHHHERVDGKGYPDGLTGDRLSLGAKILCIADSFDAMTSERPYRKRLSVSEAFEELRRCSGTQFDPEIVKVFIEHYAQEESTQAV